MKRRDRERLVVLSRVRNRELSRRKAAEILGLSLRQVHRLYVRWLGEGDGGLPHRSRGRVSSRRIGDADRQRAHGLYLEHYAGGNGYAGFGPTLFAEKLGTEHGLYVSHDTARRWMQGWGLLTADHRRSRRSRRRRLRKACFGEMVQMDGSRHDWFEGRGEPCVLMVMVDDATGRKTGRFYSGETLAAALEMTGLWCREHGVPLALYVDRAGIYRSDRDPTLAELKSGRRPVTQFGRAMEELGVELILARSPQAKGRVEKANFTLQDRLAKELRLAGIASVEAANAWLETGGFFARLNALQAVAPADAADAHRPLVQNLGDVLCVKEKRTVGNDGCVQWGGRVLQLGDLKGRARPRVVEVWSSGDGRRVESLRGGATSWPWTELPARPKKVAARPMHVGAGPARKPTEKMKRQIGQLFDRRPQTPDAALAGLRR